MKIRDKTGFILGWNAFGQIIQILQYVGWEKNGYF